MRILKSFFTLFLCILLQGSILSQIQFPDIDKWNKSETPGVYTSESLWEYINGAADYYLNYGFYKLEVVEYSFSEDEYIKAEVYHHNSELTAFGIYAYERPSKADFLELGAQGYMQHSALNFYGNKYYIKVHSNQTDQRTIETIKKIGYKLAELNINSDESSFSFDEFPAKNKIENSEKYYPSNYLGYDFFSNAMEVSYKIGDDKFKLFKITMNTADEVAARLKDYFEFTGFNVEPEQDKIYEVNDTFNDLVILQCNEHIIYGVFDCDDAKTAREYLKMLHKK